MRIKPLTGHVLIKVLPPDTVTSGGIQIPNHTFSPEEQQQRAHHPEPPPPLKCKVLEIGPWKKLKNGLALLPPFTTNATVLIRNGSGKPLNYGMTEELRLVRNEDVLAVLT
jgi:co-chaperonin GroES (HSP10)